MSFKDDLNKFKLKFQNQSSEFIQGVEIALFRDVILDTPVDTGRARGNWQASFDTPETGQLDNPDPTGSNSIARAVAISESRQGGRATFFVNNLPYAVPLEYGHSQQAPGGMVRRNVARFQALVDEQANKHKL